MTTKCEVSGCGKPAKYALYRTVGNIKEWICVCPQHEEIIGNENM